MQIQRIFQQDDDDTLHSIIVERDLNDESTLRQLVVTHSIANPVRK